MQFLHKELFLKSRRSKTAEHKKTFLCNSCTENSFSCHGEAKTAKYWKKYFRSILQVLSIPCIHWKLFLFLRESKMVKNIFSHFLLKVLFLFSQRSKMMQNIFLPFLAQSALPLFTKKQEDEKYFLQFLAQSALPQFMKKQDNIFGKKKNFFCNTPWLQRTNFTF